MYPYIFSVEIPWLNINLEPRYYGLFYAISILISSKIVILEKNRRRIKLSDDEAMNIGRRLAREEGLLCGVSSGAAVAAAIKIATRTDMTGKRLVVILPSFGERYLSAPMFNNVSSIQAIKDGHL